MSLHRLLLRLALGRRLPTTSGELRVRGPSAPTTIRRDQWGVPHIDAETDTDATFALGFCQGQDRAGQLEVLWRVGRGQLSEWVGKDGLPADRMSRRIGFRRSAEQQLPALAPEARSLLEAFAHGVTAGNTVGLPKKPHEFAIVGGEPSAWDTADVLAVLKLQSFLLPSNWDVELARLRILLADGADAVTALDPVDAACGVAPRDAASGSMAQLAADLDAILRVLPRGGGSNNWAVAGSRTTTGKPLLASDPHLAPLAPPPWYLAHLRTPEWSMAGAGMAGAPGFAIGHNGFAAWGVTAGLTDNTDLFLETLGPDGASVREADGSFAPCERLRETITVKDAPDVIEEVLVTPRGPVVSPLFAGVAPNIAVSLRAVWLDPLPVGGFLGVARSRSFEAFRQNFAAWPLLPLNVLYADIEGNIGRQLIGQLPRRKGGHGLLPLPADAPNVGWEKDLVPFDEMPFTANPERGYLATANNPIQGVGGRGEGIGQTNPDATRNLSPTPYPLPPFFGADYVDGYRVSTILDELSKRADWDAAMCGELQLSVRSLPWEETRAVVLSLIPEDAAATDALALLRDWDGQVAIDSPAAAVFELFVAEMSVRVAKAKAPTAWQSALGETGLGAAGHNLFADRRVAHLSRLIRDQPAGWFARPWPAEMLVVLGGVLRKLRHEVGPGPAFWGWGHLRPLRLEHSLFGKHRWLGPAFNLGPVPCGGDHNTISQAACRPLGPTDAPHNLANMRAVFDLSNLGQSRFVLCGGQSGNPLSPNHADQFPLWQTGEAITIAWEQPQVIREAKQTLRLVPEAPASRGT